MIKCEKTPVGYRVQINGSGNDVWEESLHIIQGVYESCANSSPKDAEMYKKFVISAVLGLDGFCIFNAPSNAVRVDLSALHETDRGGYPGTDDGKTKRRSEQ